LKAANLIIPISLGLPLQIEVNNAKLEFQILFVAFKFHI